MSESEQNQTDDRQADDGPRFPKGIVGRILAVGFFIALGTFAVIQSMQGQHKHGSVGSHTVAKNVVLPDGSSEQTRAAFKAPAIDQSEFKTPGTSKFATTNPATINKPKITSKPNTAANKNTFNSVFTPPASKPYTPSSTVVSKPATTPNRYAQAQGGAPIIGNSSGFGTRNGTITNPVGGIVEKAKQNTAAAASKLTTNVKDSANGFLNASNQKLKGAANDLRSKFGPTPQGTTQAKTPINPKSSFGAPDVRSDFGAVATKSPAVNPIKVPPIENRKPIGNPYGSPNQKATNTPIANPIRNNVKPSTSPFATTTPAKAPSTVGTFGSPNTSTNRQFSNTRNQQAIPPANNRPYTQQPSTSYTRTQSQPSTQPAAQPRPLTPARTVSTPTSRPANRPSSRITTPAGLGPMLAKNTPGGRELDGVQAPALTVEKLSPQEIQVDQPADFQIVIKNVGRVSAEDVRVFDRVPDGTEFLTASEEPSRAANGQLEWQIGKLRPGQEKRIKIQLKPIRPGEIGSVAHVTFSTAASMRTLVTKPVLEITHATKPTHLIGDDVVFDVTVKNKGDGAARNVLIQEDVPRQLEYMEGYRELEYEIGTLQPGQSRRVQLSLKAAEIGKLRNIMFASAEGGIRAKHEADLEVIAPKLVASTSGPRVRYLQRNVSHTFNVSNKGTASATNVELVARLPSGLRFVGANNQGRYDASNHSVYWSLAELAREVDADVELKTMPVEVGNQPIKFETFADLDVRANAEQPLTVEHLVDVFFDIDDVVDPIEIGSDTSYRIRIVNQGTKTATNVQMQVEFPNGLQPKSVDGSLRHSISGQRITFEPINSMSPGDEISFAVTATGRGQGDHRVVVNMRTDGRSTPVSKEETTRVYSDR